MFHPMSGTLNTLSLETHLNALLGDPLERAEEPEQHQDVAQRLVVGDDHRRPAPGDPLPPVDAQAPRPVHPEVQLRPRTAIEVEHHPVPVEREGDHEDRQGDEEERNAAGAHEDPEKQR
jgi:hypothetical protein